MAPSLTRERTQGLTFVEVLAVVLTVALLVFAVIAVARMMPRHAKRSACAEHLRQTGLALHVWAGDHAGMFPWQVSTNDGGTKEFAGQGQMFRHFQAASNELVTPANLVCDADTNRAAAPGFGPPFNNANVSYFLGLDADESNAQAILAGDRNLTGGTMTNGNVLLLQPDSPADWTQELHAGAGHITLADGSVREFSGEELRRQLKASTNELIRLAIP